MQVITSKGLYDYFKKYETDNGVVLEKNFKDLSSNLPNISSSYMGISFDDYISEIARKNSKVRSVDAIYCSRSKNIVLFVEFKSGYSEYKNTDKRHELETVKNKYISSHKMIESYIYDIGKGDYYSDDLIIEYWFVADFSDSMELRSTLFNNISNNNKLNIFTENSVLFGMESRRHK